jgi:hypothetical protein
MNPTTVFILRSRSGGGKSFTAEKLSRLPNSLIICADDYFMVDGEYRFNSQYLHAAHKECQIKFFNALNNKTAENIIVANTNAKKSDFEYYEQTARTFGADVIFMVIENRHGGKNQHFVPENTLDRQENNIRLSLSL